MQPQLTETICCQQQWEYRHHEADALSDLMPLMHQAGQEGWESFQVVREEGATWHVFMKRPVAGDE